MVLLGAAVSAGSNVGRRENAEADLLRSKRRAFILLLLFQPEHLERVAMAIVAEMHGSSL